MSEKKYTVKPGDRAVFNDHTAFCVGTGRMGLALQKEYMEELARIQRDIGFSHIRGHGLFCDDMAIWDPILAEDGSEIPHCNFTYLDRVFDGYLALGLKPFLELGFMPKKMASGTQTIFYWQGNTTPPADYDKWETLLRMFISHLIARYGREEVASWPCEVWNEPNLPGFWEHADRDAYLMLYDHSVKAVKQVLPEMKVGGPAVCGGDACFPWIRAFLEHCRDNNVPVDFVSRHIYMGQTPERKGRYLYHDMCSPAFSVKEARETRALIDSYDEFRGIPLHITEYNTSYNPRCPTHDTLYNGTLICGMLSELGDYCDSYSYWTFGDVFEETGVYDRPFHGGFGLLADGSIPKPTWWSYLFFTSLKGECLLHTEDTVCTLDDTGVIRAVLWNLCQKEKEDKTITLTLPVPEGNWCAVTRTVDHENANPLAAWHAMGEPASLTPPQKQALADASHPRFTAKSVKAENGSVTVSVPLTPNAFALLELLPAKSEQSPGYIYPADEN